MAWEDVWRACIRPSVKQALYMLSDENPWNDQEAYGQLGKALFAAGDMLNGSIAYGVLMKPLEDCRKALEQHEKEQDVHKIDVAVNESMLKKRRQESNRASQTTMTLQIIKTRKQITSVPSEKTLASLKKPKTATRIATRKALRRKSVERAENIQLSLKTMNIKAPTRALTKPSAMVKQKKEKKKATMTTTTTTTTRRMNQLSPSIQDTLVLVI